MKNKRLGYVGILMSVLILAGCGSNDKVDGNVVTRGDAGMSISPVDVYYDPAKGCRMLFRAHAVEGDGSPISGLHIGASVVINAKVSGTDIGLMETTAPISFVDNRISFNAYHVVPNDKLIILPSALRHDTSYIGDWTIYQVDGSRVTLSGAAYNLETTNQLSYVIGNETAYIGTTVVAHIENVENNGTTLTNEKGYAYFDVVYDPDLEGQPYVIGAHTGDGYRMGAAASGQFPSCTGSAEDDDRDADKDTDYDDNDEDDNDAEDGEDTGSSSCGDTSSKSTCPNAK